MNLRRPAAQNGADNNFAWAGHPVVQEIVRRHLHGEKGNSGARPKLGLVVEGGGMRGIYSGGVLVALERLGLTEVFDAVFGESAGAINSAYFLAGQGSLGIRIYSEDLASLKFVNPLRIGTMLDVDFAIDVAVKSLKPLDVDRVLANPSRLFVALTSALTGESRVVEARRDGVPLLTLLKASAAIVPLYNRAVHIDGHPYVDGGISNPIPVRSAIEVGCTHVLVLLTRPFNFFSSPFAGWQRLFITPLLRRWPPAFVDTFYAGQCRTYNQTRDIAFGRSNCGDGVKIAVIAPDGDSPDFGRSTISRSRLVAAREDAIQKTLNVFADMPKALDAPPRAAAIQARTGT